MCNEMFINTKEREKEGCGFSSAAECLTTMCKAQGSALSSALKKKKKKEKKERNPEKF